MSDKGTLYFFTGLAGAGKSTIGGLFYEHLKAKKPNVYLWDGDQRRAAGEGAGTGRSSYSTEARRSGAKHVFQRCLEMTEQGTDVVCCIIGMYDDVRAWNREHFENYKEIYVKVTMETLYRRDQKGLYSSGAKEVVGVDLPWDEPKTPDVVIENDGDETPEAIVERLERLFGLSEE